MDKEIDFLNKDLIEQFKDKPKIMALNSVLNHQLNDMYDFLSSLSTQRNVFSSKSNQLDNIGDIVCLSRSDAKNILNMTDELDDEMYLNSIIFKILKNTCNCTYDDMRQALSIMWENVNFKYKEDTNFPATIILELDDNSNMNEKFYYRSVIRGSGIGLIIRFKSTNDLKIDYILPEFIKNHTEIECSVPAIN